MQIFGLPGWVGHPTDREFGPVLTSICKKLVHWSVSHLSLAGRVLIVNQVLLATAWYIASCWMLHTDVHFELRRWVKNFLWARSDGSTDTRARVGWHTMILPCEPRGSGMMQSRALLVKLLVCDLFPSDEPWKLFMRAIVLQCVLRYGGAW